MNTLHQPSSCVVAAPSERASHAQALEDEGVDPWDVWIILYRAKLHAAFDLRNGQIRDNKRRLLKVKTSLKQLENAAASTPVLSWGVMVERTEDFDYPSGGKAFTGTHLQPVKVNATKTILPVSLKALFEDFVAACEEFARQLEAEKTAGTQRNLLLLNGLRFVKFRAAGRDQQLKSINFSCFPVEFQLESVRKKVLEHRLKVGFSGSRRRLGLCLEIEPVFAVFDPTRTSLKDIHRQVVCDSNHVAETAG